MKTFEVCDLPVRAAKFVARKNWVITGAVSAVAVLSGYLVQSWPLLIPRPALSRPLQDDMQIRVFNYNTLERVHMFEAHSDYIRCIAVHPTQPFILTSSGVDIRHSPAHIACIFQLSLISAACTSCIRKVFCQ